MPSAPDPASEPAGRRPWVVPALIALLCLVWGSTWWAIRICLLDQPPLSSAALRFCIAGAAMAALAPALHRRERAPAPPVWLWVTAGGLNFASSYGVLYTVEQFVPSGIAAVLWAVFPLLMAISGQCVLGERLAARQLLGFVVSFGGIVCVFGSGLGGLGEAHLGYALLLFVSPVVSAIGTTLVKRYGSGTSSVLLNRNGMLLGAAILAIAAFASEQPLAMAWTTRGVLATLYLALLGTAMTFGVYFWLLRTAPASLLSLITYVSPVLAMLLGAVVGDGDPSAGAWLGTLLVAVGIALVVVRRRR